MKEDKIFKMGIAFAANGLLYAADSGNNNWDNSGDALAIIDPVDYSYTVTGSVVLMRRIVSLP